MLKDSDIKPTGKYIDVTPTPEGYAQALCHIIRDSTSAESRAWAVGEVVKAFKAAATLNPDTWGK
jgi:stage V sporulation protein SpoVS